MPQTNCEKCQNCSVQLAAELLYQLAASPDTQWPALEALRREGALTAQLDLLCQPLPKEVRQELHSCDISACLPLIVHDRVMPRETSEHARN